MKKETFTILKVLPMSFRVRKKALAPEITWEDVIDCGLTRWHEIKESQAKAKAHPEPTPQPETDPAC